MLGFSIARFDYQRVNGVITTDKLREVDWGHKEAQVVGDHHCRRSGWRQGPSKALRLRRTDYSLKGLGAIVPVPKQFRECLENICLA